MRRTRARCGGISKPSMVIADPSIGPLHGWGVDDVIDPADTRRAVIAALDMACGKLERPRGRKVPLFP